MKITNHGLLYITYERVAIRFVYPDPKLVTQIKWFVGAIWLACIWVLIISFLRVADLSGFYPNLYPTFGKKNPDPTFRRIRVLPHFGNRIRIQPYTKNRIRIRNPGFSLGWALSRWQFLMLNPGLDKSSIKIAAPHYLV